MKRMQLLVLLSFLFSLSACSSFGKKDDEDLGPYKGMTAKQLFTQAQDALAKREYETAAKRLDALEFMYPFSKYAEKAQLDLIYAYYKKKDYASSAVTAQRFIQLYPRAKHVDYAYYMKGLANFQQPRGNLADMLPIDESWRDPGTQFQAYSDFSALVQRFPESRYRPNAQQRMIYLRNLFAQRELNTSKYYYNRKMYVASVERADYLVKNYPQSPAAQEGLAVLYYANKKLGLHGASDEALAVYRATYHKNPGKLIFN
jgi:outer membrane protein assembly factor BamD